MPVGDRMQSGASSSFTVGIATKFLSQTFPLPFLHEATDPHSTISAFDGKEDVVPTRRQRLISQPLDFDPRGAVMILVKQAINPGQRDAGLVDV